MTCVFWHKLVILKYHLYCFNKLTFKVKNVLLHTFLIIFWAVFMSLLMVLSSKIYIIVSKQYLLKNTMYYERIMKNKNIWKLFWSHGIPNLSWCNHWQMNHYIHIIHLVLAGYSSVSLFIVNIPITMVADYLLLSNVLTSLL